MVLGGAQGDEVKGAAHDGDYWRVGMYLTQVVTSAQALSVFVVCQSGRRSWGRQATENDGLPTYPAWATAAAWSFRDSALSSASQVKVSSVRPKWPNAAVLR